MVIPLSSNSDWLLTYHLRSLNHTKSATKLDSITSVVSETHPPVRIPLLMGSVPLDNAVAGRSVLRVVISVACSL